MWKNGIKRYKTLYIIFVKEWSSYSSHKQLQTFSQWFQPNSLACFLHSIQHYVFLALILPKLKNSTSSAISSYFLYQHIFQSVKLISSTALTTTLTFHWSKGNLGFCGKWSSSVAAVIDDLTFAVAVNLTSSTDQRRCVTLLDCW